MASLEERRLVKGKAYVIVFYRNGKKEKIYLGRRYKKREAETACSAVEAYLDSEVTGEPLPRAAQIYFDSIPSDLASRMAVLGIRTAKSSITIKEAWNLYAEDCRTRVKPSSINIFYHCYERLTNVIGENEPLSSIDDKRTEELFDYLKRTYSPATVTSTVSILKMFSGFLQKKEIIEQPLFTKLRGLSKKNPSRAYYVSPDMTKAILKELPSDEWRLLFALWRLAGMRRSEPFYLTRDSFDLDKRIIRVTSPKTAHCNKGTRITPILPELMEVVKDKLQWVGFKNIKETSVPYFLSRSIVKAGYETYPRIIQNLRSSFETDLVLAGFPQHVVASWLGHSLGVQEAHYLQVTSESFERASTTNLWDN